MAWCQQLLSRSYTTAVSNAVFAVFNAGALLIANATWSCYLLYPVNSFLYPSWCYRKIILEHLLTIVSNFFVINIKSFLVNLPSTVLASDKTCCSVGYPLELL